MSNALFSVPVPRNEPVRDYAAGSVERDSLRRRIAAMQAEVAEIPVVIGGQEVRTGRTVEVRLPHDHGHRLAICHQAGAREIRLAIDAAREARSAWSALAWEDRAAVFLKAAELLAGPWRDTLNAATVLGQSKTLHQAEIDSACELIDFWRFNVQFMAGLMANQPLSSPGTWNRLEYRALEGFVFAVTPFNFTAIGGNLPTAPAMMGNVVLWKPAGSSVYANYQTLRLLEAAGLPPGVINFLPGEGAALAAEVLAHPDLAGVHFTGSTEVFNSIWSRTGAAIAGYRQYPRLVGETGGKDFIFAHPSAAGMVPELVVAAVRGAFEFQGQKCSAASRMYLPRSLWPTFREQYVAAMEQVRVGNPAEPANFMGAVIDRKAYDKIHGYIEAVRAAGRDEIITGGGCDGSTGYFIQPTTIVTADPRSRTMTEEIFGPVLTLFVYDDADLDETLTLCDQTSPYALTGAVWARDRQAIAMMTAQLRNAAGNFYINDKPTGAVVGQQPFGGARRSGTNDKAGSALNLLRWISARTIKESFVPPGDWRYPCMEED